MAKVIKLTDNNNVTLLPLTDARYVQISYAGVTQSVADTILENEEVTAAALNELNLRIANAETTVSNIPNTTINASYTSGLPLFSYTTDGTTNNSFAPIATSSQLGVVKLGYTSTQGGFPVRVNSDGTAFTYLGINSIDGVKITDSAIDMIHYGSCSTAAGTAQKDVTIKGFKRTTGAQCIVYFSNTNSAASPTLKINSETAGSIYWHGVQVKYQTLVGGHYYLFVWNGSYYQIVGSSMHATPYGACSTAAGTAQKDVTAPGFHLCSGATLNVKFTNPNTVGTPTLNVNSFGGKSIFYNGANVGTGVYKRLLRGVVQFVYDGTQFNINTVDCATYLDIPDTRTVSDAPYTFPKAITAQFKQSGTNDLARGYSTILEITGWGSGGTDTSGGPTHELAFTQTNGEIWHRTSSNASTWNKWEQIQESYDMNLTSSLNASTNVQTLTFSYTGGTRTVDMNIRYDIVNSNMENLSLL